MINYDEIRKELDGENLHLELAEIEVEEAKDELVAVQNTVRAHKKQVKALRQILRHANEPYEAEKLKGVG